MAVRASALYKNHNLTLYIPELSPLKHLFFIMVACPGHILERTKGIDFFLCHVLVYKKCLITRSAFL